jgi:hypothetical protein
LREKVTRIPFDVLALATLVELPQLARSILAALLVQGYLEWELLLLVRGKREPLSRE